MSRRNGSGRKPRPPSRTTTASFSSPRCLPWRLPDSFGVKRLSVTGPARTWVEETLSALLARTLPLSHDVAVEAYELPDNFHRDPADRLLWLRRDSTT